MSFTPCVYPLIPISAGYIGVKAGGSKLKGFTLSLIFVGGVAMAYSLLGILASLTGRIFGAYASHPITYIFVGIIVIIFGISMLDVFTMPLPKIFKPQKVKKEGYFPTFILGLSSGLVVSPCVTPVLGTILVYLTTQKSILYGATLLFVFAYGMGFILILAGSFSAILVNFPKSGKWMLYIKKGCAFIIILMGLYFVYNAIRRFQG